MILDGNLTIQTSTKLNKTMKIANRFNTDRSSVMATQDLSDAILEMIQQQITRLRQEYNYILDCQVSATVPAFYHEGTYRIEIALKLPDQELKIDREPIPDYYQEDIYVAIWSAFDLARKKLKAHSSQTNISTTATPVKQNFPLPNRTIRRCRGYAQG
jgi:ribosome-associated translation inhibitor RaiA